LFRAQGQDTRLSKAFQLTALQSSNLDGIRSWFVSTVSSRNPIHFLPVATMSLISSQRGTKRKLDMDDMDEV
jgi:hypothetical protein